MAGKILVTGATGTVGSAVVQALAAKGADFVAAARDAGKTAAKFGPGVAAVAFDFADPATYQAATRDVEKVFLLGPPIDPDMDRLLTPFVHFLQEKGINRLVYLSAFGVEQAADVMPFHANLEQLLQEGGFDLTILRPTFFAQNFKNYEWENIVDRKIIFSPAGTGKAAFVDIRDVGEVAAKVLLEPGHTGKVYELTGPEPLGYAEVADLLSAVRQEPIHYPSPSTEAYAQALSSAGVPDFVAGYMNKVYSLIRDGHVATVSPDFERLTGRRPAPLKRVLEQDFGQAVGEALGTR